MPRLVRRAPLSERIAAYLNPWDFMLWVSEELNSNEWEDGLRDMAPYLGVAINIIFMIARANSGASVAPRGDDVFGDFEGRDGSGWFTWFCTFLVHFLSLVCVTNAIYTFYRTRNYRLFEQSVDNIPSTPSAHRVKVDSSPLSSSPLRLLSNVISAGSAASRAHPDAARDVWEISVWDPTPFCLKLFCLFSPGHVLVYWKFLPTDKLDPRPSVTVATTMLIAVVLSIQLSLLQVKYTQQTKDTTLIHRQVMSEYDTKFVHPSLNRPYRDVGIQTPPKRRDTNTSTEVDTYKPSIIINRGFRTNPNPAYSSQYDPDHLQEQVTSQRTIPTATPSFPKSPYHKPTYASTSTGMEVASPVTSRSSTVMRQPQFRPPTVGGGDGGSLGVYSHAASPLRKAASTNSLRAGGDDRRDRSPVKRETSPLKRTSTPSGFQSPLRDPGHISGLNARLAPHLGRESGRRESGRFN